MKLDEVVLTERQFVTRYLLARAEGHAGGLSALTVIEEARKAWKALQTIPDVDMDAE